MNPKPTRGGKREGSGRHPKPPGEKLVTVSVCVSPVAAQKLADAAEAKGIPKSKVADAAFRRLRAGPEK